MSCRILIIKLAAIGDVIRTTSLLSGLKRTYPYSHITWVVDEISLPILQQNTNIDRVISFNFSSLLPLDTEVFDLIIGLEKEPRGAVLVSKTNGKVKLGFGLGSNGKIYPLNKDSMYSYNLGLDDNLKFHKNKKTYPELIYDMIELDYKKDEYQLFLSNEDLLFAKIFSEEVGFKKKEKIIGLNTGCGNGFANKAWVVEEYVKLILVMKEKYGELIKFFLLGGPNEEVRNRRIKSHVGGMVIDSGCSNTLGQFVALVNLCDVVVSGDTAGLHIAIGMKKKVVALFGMSPPQEIELYGRGEKVISNMSCAPCCKRNCQKYPNCMDTISAEEVIGAVSNQI